MLYGPPAHGHLAPVIPIADVEAGIEKTYTLTGDVVPHSFTLTPSDFQMLRQGDVVMRDSTIDLQHNHQVTIQDCLPAE